MSRIEQSKEVARSGSRQGFRRCSSTPETLDAFRYGEGLTRSATGGPKRLTRSATVVSKPPKRERDAYSSRRADGDRVPMRRKMAPPKTINAVDRTIDATICSDTPVRIYDWTTDEMVDEVLLPRGMQPSDEGVQLRRQHWRYDPTDVLGSVINIRSSDSDAVATLEFSSAPDVEPIFIRVKEGHLRAVSVGGQYSVGKYTQIAAGKSAVIDGRTFKAAPDAPLRVVQEWTLEEVSIVVRGADRRATTRNRKQRIRTAKSNPRKHEDAHRGRRAASSSSAEDQPGQIPGASKMKFSARAIKYLRSLGLAADADQAAAVIFARGRTSAELERLYTISPRAKQIIESQRAADEADDDDDDDDDDESTSSRQPNRSTRTTRTTRSSTQPASRSTAAATEDDDEADELNSPESVQTALRAERERHSRIRRMATADIPADLVQRACDEGWTVDQAGRRFYQHVQRQSRPPVRNGDERERGPAVHRANSPTIEGLQAAVLMRNGFNLENPHFRTDQAQAVFERMNLGWLARFNREIENGNSDAERILEIGRRYRHDSAMRTLERTFEATDRRAPSNPDTLIERSFGGSYLPRVFGAILSVGVVEGFMAYADSTRGWVSEADWNDFRDNQPIGLDPKSSLKKHTRNTKARVIELGDFGDKYPVSRYVGVFELDDMDFIDDLVGSNAQIPRQLGQMAASVRPDLVYAVLLSNPTLADGVALFHSSRGNILASNPLGIGGLTAAEAAMAVQVVTDSAGKVKARNLMAGHLVVPRSLRLAAKQLTGSKSIVSSTTQGDMNPHESEYRNYSDARLDVGVVDPRNDTQVAGSATRWFVGEVSGQVGLQVGYRRGTGRAPQLRGQRNMTPGVWGYGWDVNMDVGIGVVSPVGLVRCDP